MSLSFFNLLLKEQFVSCVTLTYFSVQCGFMALFLKYKDKSISLEGQRITFGRGQLNDVKIDSQYLFSFALALALERNLVFVSSVHGRSYCIHEALCHLERFVGGCRLQQRHLAQW
jgi:hypothetical protein